MARDGSDSRRGVVGSVSKKIQAELGILAISLQQSAMGCLGLHDRAYALIFLQFCLGFLNVRSRTARNDETIEFAIHFFFAQRFRSRATKLSNLKLSKYWQMI
jgi:hypothetical protein